MNVTIKDVARAAGVSVATVSRVLNNSAAVSAAAAESVRDAINELGYSPNYLGRNLRKRETNIILAIIPSTDQTFYSGIIKGMQTAASELGYDILMSTSNSTCSIEMRLLNMLFNRTVDAAILLGTKLDPETLAELNRKYRIALCCERIEDADILTVTVDDEGGAFDAVNRMIKMGHRRVGMISSNVGALSAADREKGYRNALRENGITPREKYIYRGGYDFADGIKAMEYFMSLPDAPSAVFCISDILAAGAVKKALSLGMNIGGDISVCGFDNILLSEMYTPGITTVEQPCYDIGRTVVRELIGSLSSETRSDKRITLPYRFVERESVKPYYN